MSRDWKKLLRDNSRTISRSLVVSDVMLEELLSASDYWAEKLGDVEQLSTAHQKLAKLLAALRAAAPHQINQVFEEFLRVLRQDRQEHVANIFVPESDARPMTDAHYELLNRKRREIAKFLDVEGGLLDELISCEIFKMDDIDSVHSNAGKETTELIDILLRKPDSAFHGFVESLLHTNQEHVAYILTGAGEERPMSTKRLEILQKVRHRLIEKMDTVNCPLLVEKLCACGAINEADRQRIVGRITGTAKNIALMDAIARKSDSAFDKLIAVLKDTEGHEYIAVALQGLEMNAVVDPQFSENTTLTQRKRMVRILQGNMEALVSGKDRDLTVITSFMAQNGFEVSDVTHSSIHIRFRCYSEEALGNLKRFYGDGTLNRLFTEVFCPEFVLDGLESLVFHMEEEEFERCREMFASTALMSEEHRKALCEAADTVNNEQLLLSAEVGELLSQMKSLCTHRKEAVLAAGDPTEQLKTLFDVVSRQPDRVFTELINALRATDQHEIADILETRDAGDGDISIPEKQRYRRTVSESFHSQRVVLPVRRRRVHSVDLPVSSVLERVVCRQESWIISSVREETTVCSTSVKLFDGLPMELLESVLLRTFIRLLTVTVHCKSEPRYRIHSAGSPTYSTLAAVCYNWWQTLNGWPQSTTKHWLRHRIRHSLQNIWRPYDLSPTKDFTLTTVPRVRGVVQRDNKLFVVRSESNAVFVFDATDNKFQSLQKISLGEMNGPTDMVGCTESRHIYVAGKSGSSDCVLRMSLDGKQVETWLPKSTITQSFSAWSLSVTSGRLLVTSNEHCELILYDLDRTELNRIRFPDLSGLWHSAETSRGTFVVGHAAPQRQVREIDPNGDVIGLYDGPVPLGDPYHIVVDSRGRILVADWKKDQVLLLNCRLELEAILLDDVPNPMRLCLVEETGQLFIGSWMSNSVELYKIGSKKR